MPDSDEPVFFLLPDGTEISDDPRWKEQKFKEKIEAESHNLQALTDFAAKQQAERFANGPLGNPEEATETVEDDASSDHSESEFSAMTVADLKAEAEERDIDIKALGIKKKSELVAALVAHDSK